MDSDLPRVRLRAPSASPPQRIRLRPPVSSDDDSDANISTPHRRTRGPATRPQRRRKSGFAPATTVTVSHSRPLPTASPLAPPTPTVRPNFDFTPSFSPFRSHLPDEHHITTPNHDEGEMSDAYMRQIGAEPSQGLENAYDCFVEAVLSQVCSVYQLTQRMFLVNGWNSINQTPTPHWYHLVKMDTGDKSDFVCMCSSGKSTGHCFHTRFLAQYGLEQFTDHLDISVDDNQTFFVSRQQEIQDGVYSNMFSVPQTHNPTIRNRAIVRFLGTDDGKGSWTCSRHVRDCDCHDIMEARKAFQRLVRTQDGATDAPTTATQKGSLAKRAGAKATDSISYLPRPVPIWARITSDPPSPATTTLTTAPEIITLESDIHCQFCKSKAVETNPFLLNEVVQRSCTIYGLTTTMESQIERKKCSSCNRWLGPDCRDLGLFNWDNKTLMTHQLLDDYTSCFTTSETPFTSWVAVVSRRYPPHTSFVPERTFRNIWFSYIHLVQFEGGGSTCPTCGPMPDAIIFDGVSLSFNRKHLLPSLRPPTSIHHHSVIREKVARRTHLQLLPERSLRKDMRKILTGPSLLSHQSHRDHLHNIISPPPSLDLAEESEESGSSIDPARRQRNDVRRQAALLKEKQALLARVNLIPPVTEALSKVNPALGTLFQRLFGVPNLNAGLEAPSVYKKFFIQISAEESSLQMMNHHALQALLRFIQSPCKATASLLILIPALYNVLQYELSTHQQILADTLAVASWLYLRGETVRKSLIVHATEDPNRELETEGSWKENGCYYQMPQIRHRPQYPGLKEDTPNAKDSGSQAKGGCRKFYTTYSPKRLTGGIMVAWCSHSISYGFHCIPVGEGRNDVFSALYTRWEKAPPVVVYDFSCALGPYCLLREPEFFQDTLFVIDDFHASDHTKCCPSSFLATYCDSDPRLLLLNSSAAECGNGGLGRIRKSVSYMGQDRAVVYCMVFLSVWNRHRIRKMEKITG